MRAALVILFALGAGAAPAGATPTSVTITESDLQIALAKLVVRDSEPLGLEAKERLPALALDKGDIVRAINGRRPLAPIGLEVHDVAGTVLAALGLQDRDVIKMVNGVAIESEDRLITASPSTARCQGR